MSFGNRWQNLNPYDLHKAIINEYFLSVRGSSSLGKRDTSNDKRDFDIIRENHQFLWNDNDLSCQSWEKKLAKKYYDKLFKEYCLADLSKYKENKIGLRWRTEKELIDGKGQFSCGNKRCTEKNDLKSWEVNFGYVEHKIKKNALVKLRLCPDCSKKLNYHYKKQEFKRLKPMKIKSKFCSLGKNTDLSNNSDTECKTHNIADSNKIDSLLHSNKTDIWKQNNEKKEEEISREEEFNEYLNQLFL